MNDKVNHIVNWIKDYAEKNNPLDWTHWKTTY